MPGIKPLLDPLRFVREFKSSVRVGDFHLVKGMGVFGLGKIKTVGSFMPDHAKPGFVFVCFINPFRSHIGDDIGVITGNHLSIARDIEFSVKVFPLALVGYKGIEAWPWVVVFLAHVPFSEISGLISGIMECTGKTLKILRILSEVINNSMGMGVFT